MVVPNVMGVAVLSPPLDQHFNSMKGVEFLNKFANHFHYNDSDVIYGYGLLR